MEGKGEKGAQKPASERNGRKGKGKQVELAFKGGIAHAHRD